MSYTEALIKISNTIKNSMRFNENTALLSRKILLVPYEPHHVPTYHSWMEDPKIREATASERLTLEQEFEMQDSWRNDKDKLTFICVLPPSPKCGLKLAEIVSGREDTPGNLLGDVNLFIFEDEDDEEEIVDMPNQLDKKRVVGEIELMIPITKHQGNGYGRAAVLLFLAYIIRNKSGIENETGADEISKLKVKINQDNIRSIRLFESIGFIKTRDEPNYFGEFELWANLDSGFGSEIEKFIQKYELGESRQLAYIRP